MKRVQFAGMIAAAALIAGGAGACGSDEPDAPPAPPRVPVESPAKPDEPKPQEPAQTPESEPRDTGTDDRPLPEECKHPAGGSVRQSCIEEFGSDGVGPVSPVPPERDRDDDGIDDSVQEGSPEPEPSQEERPGPTHHEEPEPSQDEDQVPPAEEQIEQCTEQTGSPEACREKIDP